MASKGRSLTDRRLKKKQEDEYQKRLKNVKGKLDLTPPRNMTYTIQLNRVHAEQERQAAIDKQNLVIIERLSGIKKSPSRVDHMNKDWKPRTDRLKKFRERRQRKIDEENRLIAERLQNVESYYSVEDWEKDYKKHMYYLSMMENSTKDYDNIDDEEDDFEEDNSDEEKQGDNDSLPPVPPATPTQEDKNKGKNSDEEDNNSLPPIEDKGKRNSQGQDDKDTDEYSEQDAIMDAEELHTAIEENNKDKILEILGRTTEKEMFQELCDKYKEIYKTDLMEDLKSKVDEDAMKFLETQSSDSSDSAATSEDAKRLHDAMKGLGTDEDTIIEILCTRNNKELAAIRDEYKKQFDNTLEEDLKGDTSGDVEKLLVQLSKGEREESEKVDQKLAKKDAEALIAAGIGSWGTNEEDFIRVFTMRSLPQLAAMYPEYNKLAKMDIAESIDKEMDGDLQKTFLAIVKYSRDPSGAQADKLTKALEDGDTATIANIILPLNQAKLSEVCTSYEEANKRKLKDDISKNCDGDLKAMLLAKLDEQDESKKDKNKDKKENKDKKGDKLPPLGKKNNQQKKKEGDKKKDQPQKKADDKKQDKNKDNAKKDEDTSQKDADELYQAVQDKDKEKIIDILAKNCPDPKKLQKLQDKYKQDHDEELPDSIKSVVDDEDLQDPIDCLFTPSDEYDAKCLNDAIKGIGTDEDMLIQVLCTRTNEELAKIQETYEKKYNTSLESDIKGDTSGDFEELLVKLLRGSRDDSDKVDKSVAKKDAETLYKAGVDKFGTDEEAFITILLERNTAQLNATLAEYQKLSKEEIEESIDKEMSGDFQKGLLVLVKTIRNPIEQQSSKLAECLDSGNTETVARLILSSDKAKLNKVMSSYKAKTSKTLDAEVDKKCSDNLKKLLLAKMGKGKDGQQKKNNQGKDKDKGKVQSKPAQAKKQGDAAKGGKKDGEESNLHKAIEAKDKKKITDIIVQHASDKAKLKKLAENYKKDYKKDLVEVLDSNIEKDLYEAVAAMLLPAAEADARCLYLAMKGAGTNEAVLIEILCTRTNSEITEIKDVYEKKYEQTLENAVKSDTSGDFEDLLVALLQCKRDESTDVNDDQAHKDAETLIEAGIKKWGTDESCFIEIFTTRSLAQLQATLDEYAKWAKCEIEETITSEMDGDLQEGLLVVVKSLRDPAKTKVDSLHTALQSGDKNTVARLLAGYNQATMTDLETAYNSLHKPKLYFELEKRCSPDVKKILLPKVTDKTQEKTTKKVSKTDAKNKQTKDQKKTKDSENDCSKLHTAIEKNDKKAIKEIILRNATEKSKVKKLAEDYEKQNKAALVDQLDSKVDEDIHEAVAAMVLPSAEADARTLFYAMKGIGTKETQLIEILCTRSNKEIKDLTAEYRKKYGRSLVEDVKGDISGDFEKLLTDLLAGTRDESTEIDEDKAHNDAAALYEAGVKSWGTDEDKFIEILTTRSTGHLQAMMAEYEKLAGVQLQESIKDEMDGDLCDGLIMLLSCVQDSNKSQAGKVHNALQDGDTATVARIIAGADQDTIAAIEESYNGVYDPKLYFEVDKKCSEDLKKIIQGKLTDKSTRKKSPTQKRNSAKRASQSSASKNKKNSADKSSNNSNNNSDGSPEKASKPAESPDKEAQEEQAKNDNKEDRPKLEIVKVDYHGTISPAKGFDADKEAEKLKKAMKGFGSDEDAIMDVLASCNSTQRQEIIASYKKQYDKDLIEELKSELSGKFEDTIVALLTPAAIYDANSLNTAMKGLGTDEDVLTEIICSRSSEEIQEINAMYKKNFGKELIEVVKDETSGDLCDLLIALLQGKRASGDDFDEDAAYGDAHRLYEAGEKKWGTDESMFVNILTTRSATQLKAIFQAYKNVSKKDIVESIDDELSGDFQKAAKTLVTCVRNPPEHFAECLHDALTGLTTSNTTAARVMITRAEIDLMEIKQTYSEKYGKSLADDVKDCLKGDQEALLLKILGD